MWEQFIEIWEGKSTTREEILSGIFHENYWGKDFGFIGDTHGGEGGQ